ncbi:MAG: hypothetical protein IPI42_10740 [Saprospiraceae bacterium]|nr:hypothetical protein [Candidatus Parvibacillus calidus]
MRIQQKYPSTSKYYKDRGSDWTSGTVTSIDYRKDTQLHVQEQSEQGVYFLRTNMDVEEERIVWRYTI